MIKLTKTELQYSELSEKSNSVYKMYQNLIFPIRKINACIQVFVHICAWLISKYTQWP